MDQSSFQNLLIRKMGHADFLKLADAFEHVDLKTRDLLVRPGYLIEHVYFPECGQVSVLAKAGPSEPIEVGTFGREGMSDMMPTGRSPLESIVQIAGRAHRIERLRLMQAVQESGDLSDLMLRYENFMLLQLSYTALSHGGFTIIERLARWLLMAHDRCEGDEMPLTHDFFSWMLAVRRAGVTNAFKAVRDRGAIEMGRGNVRIVSRDILIELAAGSYGPAEAEYERLIGLPATKGGRRTPANFAAPQARRTP